MPRSNKSGVRGLYRAADGRFRIDLRWREPSTGEWRRHREMLPAGVVAVAAKNRAREILSAALAGNFNPNAEEPKRLGEALDEYLKWAVINRPRSIGSKRTQVKALKAGLGADTRLDDLSAFAVERFKRARTEGKIAITTTSEKSGQLVEKRHTNKVGPASINRALAVLKHACGLFVAWGWMKEAVAAAVRAVKLLREPPGRVRFMSPDEEAKLFAELPAVVQRMVEAADLSGCRRAEIVTLKRSAVDLIARELTLTRTKSGKLRRVPINDRLDEILRAALAASPGSEYVFTTRRGLPYSADSLTRAFGRACSGRASPICGCTTCGTTSRPRSAAAGPGSISCSSSSDTRRCK